MILDFVYKIKKIKRKSQRKSIIISTKGTYCTLLKKLVLNVKNFLLNIHIGSF